MPRKTDNPLINMLMEPALLRDLEEWRFNNRFPSRSAAMQWLLETRLAQKPTVSPAEIDAFKRRSA